MTRDDAPAFAALLAGLAEVFDVALTPTRVELYFRALEDMPMLVVTTLFTTALRHSKFFPKPAELRALISHGDPTELEEADQEWLNLISLLHQSHARGALLTRFDDEITLMLVTAMWGNCKNLYEWWRDAHNIDLERQRVLFCERYVRYAKADEDRLYELPGGHIFTKRLEALRAENHRRVASDNP